MFNTQHRMIVFAIGVAVFFTVGLTKLFLVRFEAGDVYPAYSSLRSDPLGTQVLFESLNHLKEHSAERSYDTPDKINMTAQTTVLVCGLEGGGAFLKNNKIRTLMDHVALSGGRLVLTFTSRLQKRNAEKEVEPQDKDDRNSKAENESSKAHEDESAGESEDESAEDFSDKWLGAPSLGFGFMRLRQGRMDDTASRVAADRSALPPAIPWRTNLYFSLEDEDWQTIYAWRSESVVAERPWGRGTIVLSADSYLFSNEAMRNHRFPDLLAWLVDPGHTVIFDEFHHGLVHRPGIASLARKYKLHGFFAALVLVVILFVWRQAVAFVPPTRETDEGAYPTQGRDTGQGLADLMRSHIQAAELIPICFDTWRQHGAGQIPETLVEQVQALVNQVQHKPKQFKPVEIYRRIYEMLKQGKQT